MEQKRTKENKEKFLENHIRCKRYVSRTCEAAGVSRWTFYHWKRTDLAFADRLDGEERNVFRKEMFIEGWAKMRWRSVADLCRQLNIGIWTFYNWRKQDPTFLPKMREAFDAEMERKRKLRQEKWPKSHTSI